MIALRAALLLALPSLLSARWCQVENVKADVEGDYTFAGPWRVDTCTTLLLDHGRCDEDECPHRKQFEDEEIIELADALHGNTVLTALDLGSNKLTDESVKALAEALLPDLVPHLLNTQEDGTPRAYFADPLTSVWSEMSTDGNTATTPLYRMIQTLLQELTTLSRTITERDVVGWKAVHAALNTLCSWSS